jgi:hypothetical protein
MELTPEQLEFVRLLSLKSHENSDSGCKPVLLVDGVRLERKEREFRY